MNENTNLIDINENPINLFDRWFQQAKLMEIDDPNAMNLSTVTNDLQPSSRIVLLKSFNDDGFVFYSNLDSKKGVAIKKNSQVALNFYWKSLKKQVRIEGKAIIVKETDADEYFDSRSEDSKIGAWASHQSLELKSREELEKRVATFKKKFKGSKITRPKHWSGYKVIPKLIEFWQEMPFRLHDRVEFIRYENKWKAKKLYP